MVGVRNRASILLLAQFLSSLQVSASHAMCILGINVNCRPLF